MAFVQVLQLLVIPVDTTGERHLTRGQAFGHGNHLQALYVDQASMGNTQSSVPCLSLEVLGGAAPSEGSEALRVRPGSGALLELACLAQA